MTVREMLEQIRGMRESDPGIMDAEVELLDTREDVPYGMFPNRIEWHQSRSMKVSTLKLFHQGSEGWWYGKKEAFPSDMRIRAWREGRVESLHPRE